MDAAGAAAAAEVELLLLRVDSAIASRCGGGGEEISREVLLVDMDRAGREWDGAAAAAAVVVIVMVGLELFYSVHQLLQKNMKSDNGQMGTKYHMVSSQKLRH